MNLMDRINLLKIKLESLRHISAENEIRIMQKFKLDGNYHSNHLEGNQLTIGETKTFLLYGLTAQGKPLRDHLEIKAHDEVITEIIGLIKKDVEFNHVFVRNLHKILLREPYEIESITIDGKKSKKKKEYDNYLSENEINEIVKEVKKDHFEVIKKVDSGLSDFIHGEKPK